jgi:hypothetical protein
MTDSLNLSIKVAEADAAIRWGEAEREHGTWTEADEKFLNVLRTNAHPPGCDLDKIPAIEARLTEMGLDEFDDLSRRMIKAHPETFAGWEDTAIEVGIKFAFEVFRHADEDEKAEADKRAFAMFFEAMSRDGQGQGENDA